MPRPELPASLPPVEIHEHVQAVFDELHITPADYFLFTSNALIPVADPTVILKLNESFADREDFGDDEQAEFEEEFATARAEFIEEKIQPIIDAKNLPASALTDEHLELFNLDEFDADKILVDLVEFELPLEQMSLWQLVTALGAGAEMGETYESAPVLGALQATGAYVTDSWESFGHWRVVAQYTMGQKFYELFDAFESENGAESLYEVTGVHEVNTQMRDLIDASIFANGETAQLNEKVITSGTNAAELVHQYIPLIIRYLPEEMHGYPDQVSDRFTELLNVYKVSWEQLMFYMGGSIFPTDAPVLFQFDWFANIQEKTMWEIQQLKQKQSHVDYNQVLRFMGDTDNTTYTWTAWDEHVLLKMFPKQEGFRALRSTNPDLHMARRVFRFANLPYLISNAEMKAYIYRGFQMAESSGQQNVAEQLPVVEGAAWEEIHTPELAAIFNEMKSLSPERTWERMGEAMDVIDMIEKAEAAAVSGRLINSLGASHQTQEEQ